MKSWRYFSWAIPLIAIGASGSALAVQCEIKSVPPGRPRCPCASIQAVCNGKAGWLYYNDVPDSSRKVGAKFSVPTIKLAESNKDLAPAITLSGDQATAVLLPEKVPCKNPRLAPTDGDGPAIQRLSIPGCKDLVTQEVLCDSDQPKGAPDALFMVCELKPDGSAPSAKECAEKSLRKPVDFANLSGRNPSKQAGYCRTRDENDVKGDPVAKWGIFQRVLPESACKGGIKEICLQYANCEQEGAIYFSRLGCAFDSATQTCPATNACADDPNVNFEDYAAPKPVQGADKKSAELEAGVAR